jgi:eukaryotic-like serine/threonine-protein kinase
MATVFHGHDRVLERDVAVKVLHRHLADDPALLDRFLREARAAAALTHPNVVAVYDWGEDGEDAYLVMEHVDGPSLRDVLRRRGRLGPAETAAIIAPAARGLAAAHGRGLVHRDVKPENILIDPDGSVKVTDFGLARAAAATTQTFAPGSLVGSPHYIPPEAVNDDVVDARADVYSLGIVMYECVVGRPPFDASNAMATAVQHTQQRVPPPSRAVPGLPEALDAIVLQATAPRPQDRFEDAAALEAAIRSAVPPGMLPGAGTTARQTVVIPPERTETVVPPAGPARTERMGGRVVPAPAPMFDATDEADVATTAVQASATLAADSDEDGPPTGPPAGSVARPRRRRGVARAVGVLLVLGAIAAGAALAWSMLIAPVTEVPDVRGDDLTVAEQRLREAGLDPVVNERVHRTDIPEGQVISQGPTGEARLGSTVELVVSAGPRPVTVPDVVGATEEDAIRSLRQARLDPAAESAYDEEVAVGRVISTAPAGGADAREGDTVEVVVSLGPRPIEVPAVIGQSRDRAVASIEDAGLRAVIGDEVHHDEIDEGAIVGQQPAAGESLRRGETVTLVVSLGPRTFAMPEVRGEQREEAVSRLEDLGLTVDVREVRGFFRESGEVAEQEPSPGTSVRRGERVTIYVWR